MGDVTHTAVFKSTAVTAAQDLFEVKSSTAASTIVHGFVLSQSTEVADAAEEMLVLTTNRAFGASTSGTGGAAVTAAVRVRGTPAFGGTIERNNTTQVVAGSGTLTTDLEVHVWNERVPYVFWYPPEARPVILPGETWTLELETTPADSVTMSGTLYLEQVGT
jgi:hypothetical protein